MFGEFEKLLDRSVQSKEAKKMSFPADHGYPQKVSRVDETEQSSWGEWIATISGSHKPNGANAPRTRSYEGGLPVQASLKHGNKKHRKDNESIAVICIDLHHFASRPRIHSVTNISAPECYGHYFSSKYIISNGPAFFNDR